MGLTCQPQEGQLPVVYKVNHLATRLSGETPDGVFEGGQVTIDLGSPEVQHLEERIGFRNGANRQSNALATHWGSVRTMIAALQGTSGNVITQTSLTSAVTDEDARFRAAVLLESASTLISIMGQETTCTEIPRFAFTPDQIRSNRNTLGSVANLYVAMGGEEDDGGLPDPNLAVPVTITDADLGMIDSLVGYQADIEPDSDSDSEPGWALYGNWHAVRAMVVALRTEANVIDGTQLGQIGDAAARQRATVIVQSLTGMLRIMRSEDWQAGRAYGTEAAAPADLNLPTTLTANADGVVSIAAPASGWPEGISYTVDGGEETAVTGNNPISVTLTSGSHTLGVNAGTVSHSIEVTVPDSTPVADAGTPPTPVANTGGTGGAPGTTPPATPSSEGWSTGEMIAGALTFFGLGAVATYFGLRNRGSSNAAPAQTPPPAATPPAEPAAPKRSARRAPAEPAPVEPAPAKPAAAAPAEPAPAEPAAAPAPVAPASGVDALEASIARDAAIESIQEELTLRLEAAAREAGADPSVFRDRTFQDQVKTLATQTFEAWETDNRPVVETAGRFEGAIPERYLDTTLERARDNAQLEQATREAFRGARGVSRSGITAEEDTVRRWAESMREMRRIAERR